MAQNQAQSVSIRSEYSTTRTKIQGSGNKKATKHTKRSNFTQIPNKIYKDRSLSPYDRGVWDSIKQLCDEPHRRKVVAMSIRALARALNAKPGALHKSINLLVAKSYLLKVKQPPESGGQPILHLSIPDSIWQDNENYFKDGNVLHPTAFSGGEQPDECSQDDGDQGEECSQNSDSEGQNPSFFGSETETECSQYEHSVHEMGGDCSRSEAENRGSNTVIESTNVDSIHLIPSPSAEVCVVQIRGLFFRRYEQEKERQENQKRGTGEENKKKEEPILLHIATSTIGSSLEEKKGLSISSGYTKPEQEESDLFSSSWSSSQWFTWFNRHQGYPLSPKKKGAQEAADELAKERPLEVILTFCYMKFIDLHWTKPECNNAVNMYTVAEFFHMKNAERHTALYMRESLPEAYRFYVDAEQRQQQPEPEPQDIHAPTALPQKYTVDFQIGPDGERKEVGSNFKPPEPTTPDGYNHCTYMSPRCRSFPKWQDDLGLLWCDEHKELGDFIEFIANLTDPYPELEYVPGHTIMAGREAWSQFIRYADVTTLILIMRVLPQEWYVHIPDELVPHPKRPARKSLAQQLGDVRV